MSKENEIDTAGSEQGQGARPVASPMPRPAPKAILCPYCGEVSKNVSRCANCGGRFDHLSRQASQNAMGPWQIRDLQDPFRPGCSFETLKRLIVKGKITENTVLRGPTTRQFWSPAKRTPSVANLFGICHGCQGEVNPEDPACPRCGASFEPEADRQYMGLMPVRLLPGQASAEAVAASTYEPEPARSPTPIPTHPPEVEAEFDPSEVQAAVGASLRFEHSMNGLSDADSDIIGLRMRSDGGRRAWLILALVVTLLCLATAGGFLMLAPKMGLELPSWARMIVPTQQNDAPAAETKPEAEPTESLAGGDQWAGIIRPGIDVGRERDEAASRRLGAETGDAPEADVASRDPAVGPSVAPDEAVNRVRALIAAGDRDSLMLAREVLGEIESEAVRAALSRAIDQLEALREISDIL